MSNNCKSTKGLPFNNIGKLATDVTTTEIFKKLDVATSKPV